MRVVRERSTSREELSPVLESLRSMMDKVENGVVIERYDVIHGVATNIEKQLRRWFAVMVLYIIHDMLIVDTLREALKKIDKTTLQIQCGKVSR